MYDIYYGVAEWWKAHLENIAKDEGYTVERRFSWVTDVTTVFPNAICHIGKDREEIGIWQRPGACFNIVLSRLSSGNRYLFLQVRAAEPSVADGIVEEIREAYSEVGDAPEGEVKFEFMHMDRNGQLQRNTRNVLAPRFEAVTNNYDSRTRNTLKDLVQQNLQDHESGRIILWHGEPGTGKTFMVRTLAQEWKTQARFVYVVDPEEFFSGSSDYLIEAIAGPQSVSSDAFVPEWTVFVLEDTGEMFSSNARSAVGQGLSRLLNVSDGILGQGLKCLFLLTTNEPLYELHPALVRSGRCMSNVHFRPLRAKEAMAWAEKNDVDGFEPHQSDYTLADLYALKDENQVNTNTTSKIRTSSNVEVA